MTRHLTPAPGRRVLDPLKRTPLPPEGAAVELTIYWLRRLADGDVQEVPRAASRVPRGTRNPEPATEA